MNAEILAVGTEILIGQITNTNARYISSRLQDIGVNVYYHSVVGDNPKRLKDCLNVALQRSDVIIMTGGLGPTQDDLTKETVAEAVGKKLVLHEPSLNKIKDYFQRLGRTMVDSNIKQAFLPEGSIILPNNKGTAPGCIIENGKIVLVMLPGPPSEMEPMFEENIIPYLQEKSEDKIVSQYLKVFGIGESSVEEKLIDLIEEQTNPTIATYAKEGEVTLRVTSKCKKDEVMDLNAPMVAEIKKRLGTAVYAADDYSIAEVVGNLLREKNVSIAIAETFTGGLLSAGLIKTAGNSGVFHNAVIALTDKAKIENLGVKPETLENYGTVSKETTVEMAQNVMNRSDAEIGLSVNGITGIDDGTMGPVYVALARRNHRDVKFKELKLIGDQDRIRNLTVLHASHMLRNDILEENT